MAQGTSLLSAHTESETAAGDGVAPLVSHLCSIAYVYMKCYSLFKDVLLLPFCLFIVPGITMA